MQMQNHGSVLATIGLLGTLLCAGCESLPGSKSTQGAVGGGVAGAAAGALLADEDNRVLGAVIGGALGAGGGYLIGRELEGDEDEQQPVDPTPEKITEGDVRAATSADIDGDGNVTVAELVAMDEAGLNDDEIIARLERTDMVFDLTQSQEDMLVERGISRDVVARLETINRDSQTIGTRRENANPGR